MDAAHRKHSCRGRRHRRLQHNPTQCAPDDCVTDPKTKQTAAKRKIEGRNTDMMPGIPVKQTHTHNNNSY